MRQPIKLVIKRHINPTNLPNKLRPRFPFLKQPFNQTPLTLQLHYKSNRKFSYPSKYTHKQHTCKKQYLPHQQTSFTSDNKKPFNSNTSDMKHQSKANPIDPYFPIHFPAKKPEQFSTFKSPKTDQ